MKISLLGVKPAILKGFNFRVAAEAKATSKPIASSKEGEDEGEEKEGEESKAVEKIVPPTIVHCS